ncbi:hypothetical protein [Serratia marcescens]|uniref:hypothetical protein n=1 Tax=Serratia marcescens TaxID=615 RepID=UPI0002B88960|nr:hypothetical protein [Serratia marcescens]EMF04257.1 hypothetical protein F518_18493 [Serratia marcescens VGH107]
MTRLTLVMLLLFTADAAVAGDWVFRPTGSGALRILQQGSTADLGPDMLAQRQQVGETLTVQVAPSGMGRCENGVLSGSGPLASVKIPLLPMSHGGVESGQKITCGESLLFDAPATAQWVGVKAVPESSTLVRGNMPATLLGQRVLLGNINFISSYNKATTRSVYLDLTTLGSGIATLKASFDKTALSFGEIGNLNDAAGDAKLTISKTPDAGDMAIPFLLTFESSQQRDGNFQLKSTREDRYVIYQIKIGDKSMTPGDNYAGTVPTGSATSNTINIHFTLAAKQVNGLKAGTRLTDTLTAVITPDS